MALFWYILEDLGYKIILPQPLAMDNQSAICVVKNAEHQGCMRHLNPIYYGFREEVEAGEISPPLCTNCGHACRHPDQGIDPRAG